MGEEDAAIRAAVFDFLAREEATRGERVFPRSLLAEGVTVQSRRVPLVGPEGIFKPAACRWPISITTVPETKRKPRPYDDGFTYDGIEYRYRGGPADRNHLDNVGLREAMRLHVPLVYFHGHRPGMYHAEWPVYVVGDDPEHLVFKVVLDEPMTLPAAAEPARRAYMARLMQQRLHQSRFRELVLTAYSNACAVCRLRHRELLDAAHILPDGHPKGEPIVPNGLALCRLHHGAFDSQIIGIRPDLVIEVRRDVLEESDGPMLRHGLQGVDHQRLIVPRRPDLRPDPEFLEERYELFREAS